MRLSFEYHRVRQVSQLLSCNISPSNFSGACTLCYFSFTVYVLRETSERLHSLDKVNMDVMIRDQILPHMVPNHSQIDNQWDGNAKGNMCSIIHNEHNALGSVTHLVC